MPKPQADDHLDRWRKLRASLNSMHVDAALSKTIEYWHNVPFVPFYLTPEQDPPWPDPWTLISENYFCDIAKALGMLYTLAFTEHGKTLDLELRIYTDVTTGYQYNVVWINDGKFILNLVDHEIVNITHFDKDLVLKKLYTKSELKLDEY